MGHVTFNWNGNRGSKLDQRLETYHEVQSENVRFELEPEMRTRTIARVAHDALLSGLYDYVRVMFAAADMVGHTHDLEATKRACECIDAAIKVSLTSLKLLKEKTRLRSHLEINSICNGSSSDRKPKS
jgi:2,3-bisphosphoglycerate-independent phosphoglycerate mutase